MCRVQGEGSFCFVFLCSAWLNHGSFLVRSLAVLLLSHLRPRFAYILDHYGHARRRRRASARRGEAPLYSIRFMIKGDKGWVKINKSWLELQSATWSSLRGLCWSVNYWFFSRPIGLAPAAKMCRPTAAIVTQPSTAVKLLNQMRKLIMSKSSSCRYLHCRHWDMLYQVQIRYQICLVSFGFLLPGSVCEWSSLILMLHAAHSRVANVMLRRSERVTITSRRLDMAPAIRESWRL